MITFFFSSQLVTYRYFSSGEKAIPLGPVRSVVTNRSFPFCSEKTPLNDSSFRGSSKNFGRPNGGSVKNSAVGTVDQIVRAIQTLAVITVGEHSQRAVLLQSGHAPVPVFVDRK